MGLRLAEEVMGMPVTIDVVDPDATHQVLNDAMSEFRLLDQVFSSYLAESAVSRINRGEVDVEQAGDLVQHAIRLCRMYESATDGYFSAWIGGRFDPSGLVKAWAIDRACSVLEKRGYSSFFVDAGGDVQTRGLGHGGTPWRIGIRNPLVRDKFAKVISASDLAVATSGTYEKGNHILDPHTGRPADGLLSLTVVGPDIVLADVLATAGFANGLSALEFVHRFDGYDGYAIGVDQMTSWTPGFEAYSSLIGASPR